MDNISAPPAISSVSFFTPLIISMAGIVLVSLSIILYHLVLVKCCPRSQHLTTIPPPIPQGRRLPTGVDEKILQTIPVITYSPQKTDTFRVDQSECAVCLADLEDGDMVRLLPNCKHAFHVPCIDQWFMSHNSCPVCRSPSVAPIIHTTPIAPVDDSNIRVEQIQPQNNDRGQPCRFLRHCGSLVLPRERIKSRRLVTGLKRSLSMDQSFVVIDLQKESEGDCSNSIASSSSRIGAMKCRSLMARSVKRLDNNVSSKLLMRSFSRLGVGNGGILPY